MASRQHPASYGAKGREALRPASLSAGGRAGRIALALVLLLVAARPVLAGTVTTTLSPAADNLLLFSTSDPALQNQVFASSENSVGCNWIAFEFSSDGICASTAIRFDLPSAVMGQTIFSATLKLTIQILAADFETQYRVAAFADSWSPSTITAANQPDYFTSFQAFLAPPTSNPVEIDVTDIVRQWASGSWANNGLLLADTDTNSLGLIALRATSFYSSEVWQFAVQRPELIITSEAPAAPVVEFSADPPTVAPGGSTTLIWSASNATGCQLDIFLLGPSGTFPATPAETTTYTISCTGAGGSSSASVTVTVAEPPTVTVTADPTSIAEGETTAIGWSSFGAVTCSLAVCPVATGLCSATTVDVEGSVTAHPSADTRYIVDCQSLGGSSSDEVTVVVPEPSAGLLATAALATVAALAPGRRGARRSVDGRRRAIR